MLLHATALYAGILALLLMYLSFGVIKLRKSQRVSIGDGGNEDLKRAMRVQANCAEYAPISLILIALVEATGWSLWFVHGLGIALVAGARPACGGPGGRRRGLYLPNSGNAAHLRRDSDRRRTQPNRLCLGDILGFSRPWRANSG